MIAQLLQRRFDAPQQQLLELYWNRASVKRELTGLRRERYQLLDKLKEQEGAIIRAQEQLEGLERLLTNPVAAANAMVYFQLRRLWRTCALRVAQHATELRTQRERRDREHLHEAELSRRSRRLNAIVERSAELKEKRRQVVEQARRLEDEILRTHMLARLFKGRKLRASLDALGKNREALDAKLSDFADLSDKIQGEPLPEPDGLSVESRRTINTCVIALAQELVIHFAVDRLTTLAKATTERPVDEMRFGERAECDRLVELVRSQIEDLRRDKAFAERVRSRAEQLAPRLAYRDESVSVPTTSSAAPIAPSARRAAPAPGDWPLEINVLADNYWDVNAVLQ